MSREAILERHDDGLISNEALMLYGISGPLPEIHEYRNMTPRQREDWWSERLESRLGQNWRERFHRRGYALPAFLRMVERSTHNWLKEGF